VIVIVIPHWTDLIAIAFGIGAGLWSISQGRRYRRQRKRLGNAVYRLPVPAPGQPKMTLHIEGEEPQQVYWERVSLDGQQP